MDQINHSRATVEPIWREMTGAKGLSHERTRAFLHDRAFTSAATRPVKLPATQTLSLGETCDKLLPRWYFESLMNQRDRPSMIPSGDAVVTLTAPVAVSSAWKAF